MLESESIVCEAVRGVRYSFPVKASSGAVRERLSSSDFSLVCYMIFSCLSPLILLIYPPKCFVVGSSVIRRCRVTVTWGTRLNFACLWSS